MRFNIEKTFLKDEVGTNHSAHQAGVVLLQTEADDVGEAVRKILTKEHAELVDEVRWLPGSQAVAAIKKDSRLYMLQFSPEDDGVDPETFREARRRPSILSLDESHREQRR